MIKRDTYRVIQKIHLYASLSTVIILIMYLITSFMMIHHEHFKVQNADVTQTTLDVNPVDIDDENWSKFLSNNKVGGKLGLEYYTDDGDLFREYNNVGKKSQLLIYKDRKKVRIKILKKNMNGAAIDFHRTRGFDGPLSYNLYAILLDLVGISLILFAITGVVLWLKTLKNDKVAWWILALGFLYAGSVMGYLMVV